MKQTPPPLPTKFDLVSQFKLSSDQAAAVTKLTAALQAQKPHQVLQGATGTGKTFTIANVINRLQRSTLVLSHNKTLALQLFGELKSFFPHNRVEYFISPFDFYQPEAYLPHTDLYIDKSVKWNWDVKTMRMQTLNALLTSTKVIVVASVAAIYGVLDPAKYQSFIFHLTLQQSLDYQQLIKFLVAAGYQRVSQDLTAGEFIVRGPLFTIALPDKKHYLQLKLVDGLIKQLTKLAVPTLELVEQLQYFTLFPAQEYVTPPNLIETACQRIENELNHRLVALKDEPVLQQRLTTRTRYDLENLRELGYCKGIENYARHLDQRLPGSPPYTLLDYFARDFLVVIDESHITLPQLRGMYLADRQRKQILVDYGFRLPSALDNRPLQFSEFMQKVPQILYTSATPGESELALVQNAVIEQNIRPTGLLDPVIEIVPTTDQITRLISEIHATIRQQNRVFVLTLTIKMAEHLTEYLQTQRIKVAYIHSRLKTFERTKILINFRKGIFDVVVGINLLREGLDIPEVSLICILAADKEGFLRGRKALIQMIGRAARNVAGRVLLFADQISTAMQAAIGETDRRRTLQQQYNRQHNITPQTIQKPIQDIFLDKTLQTFYDKIQKGKTSKLTRFQTGQIRQILEKKMQLAAKSQDFELAAKIRDMIFELMKVN